LEFQIQFVRAQEDADLYAVLPMSEVDENIGKIVPPAEKKATSPDGSEVRRRPSAACQA